MPQSCEGMMPEHARTGIAHYDADLLSHGGFVAVDGTLFAGRFLLAIFAMVEAEKGVFEQCRALRAECVLPVGVPLAKVCVLMAAAVDCHHLPDGLFFPFYARHVIVAPDALGKRGVFHARDDTPRKSTLCAMPSMTSCSPAASSAKSSMCLMRSIISLLSCVSICCGLS